MSIQRRSFLQTLAILSGALLLKRPAIASLQEDPPLSDDDLCLDKFHLAVNQSLHLRPMGEVMIAVGKSFIGTTYVAGTLEARGEEHLVVNLRGLDCVTFVESTLALSRCIKRKRNTTDAFRPELQRIRYRGGKIHGYASRLHYFSDWIFDNQQKGVVSNVTESAGGVPSTKMINFMSTHRGSYRQLESDAVFAEIQRVEDELNARRWYYLPKEKVADAGQKIQEGDVLAIVTEIDGLDVSHTGLAVRVDRQLRLLHAPITGGTVQISPKSLVEHLNSSAKYTGLMIARPLDPARK